MIKIYTDGSSIGNPGPGGWTILVLQNIKNNGGKADNLSDSQSKQTAKDSILIAERQLSELKKVQPIGAGHVVGIPQSLFPLENEPTQFCLENAIKKTHEKFGNAISLAGSENHTTNNRMELTAVIAAFLYLQENNISDQVVICMDSKYVHDGLEEYLQQRVARGRKLANKRPVLNVDLRKQLYQLQQQFPNVQRERVKAHHTDKYNNLVDHLAREQAER